MSLRFVRVEGAGELGNERVVLRANADVDVGTYAIFRCASDKPDNVSSGSVLAAYWFADGSVKKNDWVVLYTKVGRRSQKEDGGAMSYFYYWGFEQPIWTKNTAAVLVPTRGWTIGQRFT